MNDELRQQLAVSQKKEVVQRLGEMLGKREVGLEMSDMSAGEIYKTSLESYKAGFENGAASRDAEVKLLRDALEYHQAQTRPIQRTIEALAASAMP